MNQFLLFSWVIILSFGQVSLAADQEVQRSKGELCVISQNIPVDGAEYSKKDKRKETELCSYDSNITLNEATPLDEPVGICPKMFSTFPAVEFFEIPDGMTKADFEAQGCNRKVHGKTEAKKVAKYKQSISCARTGSIIGYYHISRALGIKAVPPSVLRSMDVGVHSSVSGKGYSYTRSASGELISKNWDRLDALLKNDRRRTGMSSSSFQSARSQILSEDEAFSVGALSVNPRGEQKYYGNFWPGSNGVKGVTNFKARQLYAKLKTRKHISEMIGTDLTDENYSTIRQMKDAVDMIVLDTIFGQKDRFGNVHSYHTFLVVDENGKLDKVTTKKIGKMIKVDGTAQEKADFKKASDMPRAWLKETRRYTAAILKVSRAYLTRKGIPHAHSEEILLKDNDCGFKGSNVFKKNAMINGVYHISEETYVQLIKLYNEYKAGHLDSFLSTNLYMTSSDRAQFDEGLEYVVNDLQGKYNRGELFLDLNVKKHFQEDNEFEREMTDDGLPIYTVIRDGVNVRTKEVLTVGTDDSSLFVYQGSTQKTAVGDLVARIAIHTVGKNQFAEVRVLESDTLPVGETAFIWVKALR